MKLNGILSLALACALAPAAAFPVTKTLYTFNGTESEGNLIMDSAGNLYGTTGDQDQPSLITVFELSPKNDGSWEHTVLWTSTGGLEPNDIRAGLIFDADGNLYGTSLLGGTHGCGTVFELKHESDASWQEINLFSFDCQDSGYSAVGGVTFDKDGNLYGTTTLGGAYKRGVVYELIPGEDGTWSEKILHAFTGNADGANPGHEDLIFDDKGNLYGTAATGADAGCPFYGDAGCGTVFRLSPQEGGSWTFKVLHHFTGGLDGGGPSSTLLLDQGGNLYGTTYGGGKYGFGVAFELETLADDQWSEQIAHAFRGGEDGTNPLGGLIFDPHGNLYGGTPYGGNDKCGFHEAPIGCGVIYELVPPSNGGWKQNILARFQGTPKSTPYNNLVMDRWGNLYGSAAGYDTGGSGSEFEVLAP